MPESSELTVKTAASLVLHNKTVRDAHRMLAVAGASKTISGGAITLAPGAGEGFYVIDGEGAAADDLVTINGGVAGDVIVLQIANAARPITLKHGVTAGKIELTDGEDFEMTDPTVGTILRHDGTVWQMIGGAGGGSTYVLESAGTYYPAGGYMSVSERAALTWDADTTGNLDKLYDGNDGGTFWVSANQLQNSPWITVDFLQPAVFDTLRIVQTESANYASQVTVYGSTTGAFSGEEVTVATITGMTSGTMTPSIPNPASYRYWKFVFYRSSSDTYAPYEFNFNRNATLMLQGIPFGCQVKLYDETTLKETQRYNSQLFDGQLEFSTDMTGLTSPNITISRPDGTTAWLAFDSTVISNAANGKVYALFVEGK